MLSFAEIVEISEEALQLQQLLKCENCDRKLEFQTYRAFFKISLYDAVNTLSGYSNIAIHSPLKTFDCVEMKRRGAERIYNQTANMIPKEQLAFWQERTELLRKQQQTIKTKRRTSAN